MSNPVSITDLLNAIGSDNIKIQYLASCMEGIKSAKGCSLITFGTDAITPSDAVFNTGPRGLIIWVDGDLMHLRMEELKAGQGITLEKVTKQRNSLEARLEYLLEVMDRPPEANCSCHLSPPCNDCVEYGALREAIEEAEACLADIQGGAA